MNNIKLSLLKPLLFAISVICLSVLKMKKNKQKIKEKTEEQNSDFNQ